MPRHADYAFTSAALVAIRWWPRIDDTLKNDASALNVRCFAVTMEKYMPLDRPSTCPSRGTIRRMLRITSGSEDNAR